MTARARVRLTWGAAVVAGAFIVGAPAPAGAPMFDYAESYPQQYLSKNPRGYCGIGGTGVSCPVGVAAVGGGA